MKHQYIEVKVVIKVMTDEEISYAAAEQMVLKEVDAALDNRLNSIQARTEQMSPPYLSVIDLYT